MAQSAAIILTQHQQDIVERLVKTGRFDGVEDVVSAGLKLLEKREVQADSLIAELESEVERGLASGDPAPMEPATDLLLDFRSRR